MDAFAAIESVIPWEAFIASVAEAQKLVQGDDFDFLPRISEGYHVLRRYSREFLTVLKLQAAPAGQDVLAAVEYLRAVYGDHTFTLPADAPIDFRQRALAQVGPHLPRDRPTLLRDLRAGRTQKRAALGRHLGAGFPPVQGVRRVPAASREVRGAETVPALCRSP